MDDESHPDLIYDWFPEGDTASPPFRKSSEIFNYKRFGAAERKMRSALEKNTLLIRNNCKQYVDEDSRMCDKQKKVTTKGSDGRLYSFCSPTLLIRRWQLLFSCYRDNIKLKEVK